MAMKRKKTPATELAGNADPCAPLDGASLLSAAKPLLKELAADLLARADGSSAVTEALQARHLAEQKAQRTADAYPQFGLGAEVTPTLHWSSLADEPWALYQAPELRENPLARGVVSDVFSLGALAYLVLTGHPPADSVLALDERLGREHELDPRASADGIPEKVARVVELATASKPVNRADDVHEWLELLLEGATAPDAAEAVPESDPLQARAGERLDQDLQVMKVLGEGASSRVLQVEREGRPYALKVALTSEDDARLKDEARALDSLRHTRIVQFHGVRSIAGRT